MRVDDHVEPVRPVELRVAVEPIARTLARCLFFLSMVAVAACSRSPTAAAAAGPAPGSRYGAVMVEVWIRAAPEYRRTRTVGVAVLA